MPGPTGAFTLDGKWLELPESSVFRNNAGQRQSSSPQEDLVRTIQEESERLNRFINNLLDMTRLESGALKPRTAQYRKALAAQLF